MSRFTKINLDKLKEYDFEKLTKGARNAREKTRYLAFVHLKEGKAVGEVSDIIKMSKNAIYVWLRKFNKDGLEGLKEQGGRGAKLKLPLSERGAFRKAVLELQAERRGGRIKGADVLEMMKKKFGVICGPRSIYNHLKRANLVWVSSRSKHPNADEVAQEEYKNNFPEC